MMKSALLAFAFFVGVAQAAPLGEMKLIGITLRPADVSHLRRLSACRDTLCAIQRTAEVYPELVVVLTGPSVGSIIPLQPSYSWRDRRLSDKDVAWFKSLHDGDSLIVTEFTCPADEECLYTTGRPLKKSPVIVLRDNVGKGQFLRALIKYQISLRRREVLGAAYVQNNLGFLSRVREYGQIQEEKTRKSKSEADLLDLAMVRVAELQLSGPLEAVDVSRQIVEYSSELGLSADETIYESALYLVMVNRSQDLIAKYLGLYLDWAKHSGLKQLDKFSEFGEIITNLSKNLLDHISYSLKLSRP